MWSRQYLQQQNQVAAKNMNPYVVEYCHILTPNSLSSIGILSRETGMLRVQRGGSRLDMVSIGHTRMSSDSSQTTREPFAFALHSRVSRLANQLRPQVLHRQPSPRMAQVHQQRLRRHSGQALPGACIPRTLHRQHNSGQW